MIHGAGTAKLEQYGDAFLDAVINHLPGGASGIPR